MVAAVSSVVDQQVVVVVLVFGCWYRDGLPDISGAQHG